MLTIFISLLRGSSRKIDIYGHTRVPFGNRWPAVCWNESQKLFIGARHFRRVSLLKCSLPCLTRIRGWRLSALFSQFCASSGPFNRNEGKDAYPGASVTRDERVEGNERSKKKTEEKIEIKEGLCAWQFHFINIGGWGQCGNATGAKVNDDFLVTKLVIEGRDRSRMKEEEIERKWFDRNEWFRFSGSVTYRGNGRDRIVLQMKVGSGSNANKCRAPTSSLKNKFST